jgi:hypothetical protein
VRRAAMAKPCHVRRAATAKLGSHGKAWPFAAGGLAGLAEPPAAHGEALPSAARALGRLGPGSPPPHHASLSGGWDVGGGGAWLGEAACRLRQSFAVGGGRIGKAGPSRPPPLAKLCQGRLAAWQGVAEQPVGRSTRLSHGGVANRGQASGLPTGGSLPTGGVLHHYGRETGSSLPRSAPARRSPDAAMAHPPGLVLTAGRK